MKKLIKGLIKEYFLYAAGSPFVWALYAATIVFLIVFGSAMLVDSKKCLEIPLEITLGFLFLCVCFFWFLHLAVKDIRITVFPQRKNKIILLRYDDKKETEIYKFPVWGEPIAIEIVFPENWDLSSDDLDLRNKKLSLEILPYDVIGQYWAYLAFYLDLYLYKDFQAKELEEMINRQGADRKNCTVFSFQKCLENIVTASLMENEAVVKEQLLKWKEEKITVKKLEQELVKLGFLFGDLFSTLTVMNIRLSNNISVDDELLEKPLKPVKNLEDETI
ncbi:MAG: hypothetical protein WCT50_02450 [Patescibacteria group bacterium]